jgi:ribosomal protein S18 acetylase RimI-like enzyme
MEIAEADMDDVDALAERWLDLAAEQLQYGSHLRVSANRDAIRMALAGHVAEGTALVARAGAIVGFVSFEIVDGVFAERVTRGRIQNLYVDPSWRDRGVGSALMDAAEAALADAGADRIAIEAMASNENAKRLYESRGYGPHRVEYERPVDGESRSPVGNDTHTNEEG